MSNVEWPYDASRNTVGQRRLGRVRAPSGRPFRGLARDAVDRDAAGIRQRLDQIDRALEARDAVLDERARLAGALDCLSDGS